MLSLNQEDDWGCSKNGVNISYEFSVLVFVVRAFDHREGTNWPCLCGIVTSINRYFQKVCSPFYRSGRSCSWRTRNKNSYNGNRMLHTSFLIKAAYVDWKHVDSLVELSCSMRWMQICFKMWVCGVSLWLFAKEGTSQHMGSSKTRVLLVSFGFCGLWCFQDDRLWENVNKSGFPHSVTC